MDWIIGRHSSGAADFDFHRRRAAAERLGERIRLTKTVLSAARKGASAIAAYGRSLLLRSRCQPTVASGLASTEAK